MQKIAKVRTFDKTYKFIIRTSAVLILLCYNLLKCLLSKKVILQFTTLINWYLVCIVKPLFTITEPAYEIFGISHIQQSYRSKF